MANRHSYDPWTSRIQSDWWTLLSWTRAGKDSLYWLPLRLSGGKVGAG